MGIHSADSGQHRARVFVGAALGHLMEWYDYGVYGFLAAYVGQLFFVSSDPMTSLLGGFAAFALSFFIRPLGGLFFGPLADRVGRRTTLIIVLAVMAGSTAAVGILPTYQQVGVLAPVLLVAGCLMLGFALALMLTFVPFPGSVWVARLIDTFIALPTFLVTLAFTFIYGAAGILNSVLRQHFGFAEPPVQFLYSAWGVILAEITVYLPFVLRPLLASLALLDASQIEAASILGARPWRIIRQVIVPAAFPALLAGGSLCLLLTVNEFGVVLFIGAKDVVTLPLLIYNKAIQESDYQSACAIAVVNIALSLGLFSLYRVAARRLEK